MNATLINNTLPGDWLRTGEVAKQLGCCRKTVSNMAKAGKFPNAIRLTKDYRIPAGDVIAYLNRHRVVVEGGES